MSLPSEDVTQKKFHSRVSFDILYGKTVAASARKIFVPEHKTGQLHVKIS